MLACRYDLYMYMPPGRCVQRWDETTIVVEQRRGKSPKFLLMTPPYIEVWSWPTVHNSDESSRPRLTRSWKMDNSNSGCISSSSEMPGGDWVNGNHIALSTASTISIYDIGDIIEEHDDDRLTRVPPLVLTYPIKNATTFMLPFFDEWRIAATEHIITVLHHTDDAAHGSSLLPLPLAILIVVYYLGPYYTDTPTPVV